VNAIAIDLLIANEAHSLHLKSQEGPSGHTLESNAVLCTRDKTYTLRQVSTSNEVYLTQSLSTNDVFPPQSRQEAIAKCDSTLELQPAMNVSAVPYIKAVLPTFTTTGHHESKDPISKTQFFANIPLSDAECERAWQDLACFELDDPPRALLPSNGTKLKIWAAILTSATARGIDFTKPVDGHDTASITDEHDEWPVALSTAVIGSMSTTEDADSPNIHIDETKCARAVGEMLLRDRTENGRSATSLQNFVAAWADLLPEEWRLRADLSSLEGSYILENGGQDVKVVESSIMHSSSGNAAAPADAKATLGAKRKWHEKFRASKKTT
jgi:hypothetical protein